MGTTKSGRVLNTRGAAGSASQFAVVHSNEGAYTKPQKDNHIRLKSGGHGQTGFKELDKYGIEYHIVKTYPNGVRVGYVPDHKAPKSEVAKIKHGFLLAGQARTLNMQVNMLPI